MNFERTDRRSRRRKIFLVAIAALAVVAAASFLHARSADLRAWPEPAQDTSFEAPAREGPLLDAAACRALAARLPDPATAPVEAYRRFQTGGLAALSASDRAALEERLGPDEAAAEAWFEALSPDRFRGGFAVESTGDANAAADLLGRGGEMTVLEAYRIAARHEHDATNAPRARILDPGPGLAIVESDRTDREADRALAAGQTLRVFTRGAGIVGWAAALPATMLLARETLMDAADVSAPWAGDPGVGIAALRWAEGEIGDFADAIRDDWRVHRAAAREFYAAMEPGATNGPSAATKWFVRRLGGTEETTLAHVDALFSRLVENAALPYSPDGLAAGLPGWCLGKGRPPWTRDPAGAALARNYLRHAGAAAAIPPSIRLELRAARIALSLRLWRDAHGGEWPATLDPLLDGESPLLLPGDVADPFSPGGAPLRYAREPDGSGWRLWSAGLDQADGNGAIDAFHAEGADVKSSDFVFSSRERQLRAAPAP